MKLKQKKNKRFIDFEGMTVFIERKNDSWHTQFS